MTDNLKELGKALAEFQEKMEAAAKNAENPFFKSNYATFDEVARVARGGIKHGLTFTQLPGRDEHGNFVETRIIHIDTGQSLSGKVYFDLKAGAGPQDVGSGITYARRYGLQSVMGIVAEKDDDGNAAQGNDVTEPTESKKPWQK